MKEDSLGKLVQYLLYHLRSMEIRIQWSSKAFDKLRGQDKQKMTLALNRVKSAIRDIITIIPNHDVRRMVEDDIRPDDRMIYCMTLVDQLFDLSEEDLAEVTEVIDNYLESKYKLTDEEKEAA